jgi:hypothetical protein
MFETRLADARDEILERGFERLVVIVADRRGDVGPDGPQDLDALFRLHGRHDPHDARGAQVDEREVHLRHPPGDLVDGPTGRRLCALRGDVQSTSEAIAHARHHPEPRCALSAVRAGMTPPTIRGMGPEREDAWGLC